MRPLTREETEAIDALKRNGWSFMEIKNTTMKPHHITRRMQWMGYENLPGPDDDGQG